MPRFRVPRMQTNAIWHTPPIAFRAGSPPRDVDIRAWALSGMACSEACSLPLNVANGRLTITDTGALVIRLSEADCADLGPGRVDFEVMRLAPEPKRPLLRFAIINHRGLT
jgi:hypothetical protein